MRANLHTSEMCVARAQYHKKYLAMLCIAFKLHNSLIPLLLLRLLHPFPLHIIHDQRHLEINNHYPLAF